MKPMTWDVKHSVVAEANLQKVWEFHANVDNWARIEGGAVEWIRLDGPFQAGVNGETKMRGQDPRHWRLAVVEPPRRSVIETELPGAVLRFTWTFEALADARTRLSQHIKLEGPNSEAYVTDMEKHFAQNLRAGMEKIAAEMERYAAGQ